MNIFSYNGESNIKLLLLFIFLIEGFAIVTDLLSTNSQGTYKKLKQPSFAPKHGIIFPTVWTFLYFIFGIALYRLCMAMTHGKLSSFYFVLFLALVLSTYLFTVILFRFGKMKIAYIEMIIVIILSLTNFIVLLFNEKTTAFLILPYVIWILYMFAINTGVIILNKDRI